jgi:hypothetical protein
MRGRIGTVRHRAHQPRQFRQVRPRAAEQQFDKLVDTKRTRYDSPGAQPVATPALVKSRAAERDPLPQQAVLAELRERLDGPLGIRRVTGGSEKDVKRPVAQKPTRCSCEASERYVTFDRSTSTSES